MRTNFLRALTLIAIFLSAVASSHAAFIQPISISTASSTINTPIVLINAATGNGGTSYVAPNPASGGSGTSWYTSAAGTTPVSLTFNFASTTDIFSELYVWDYYTHSPSNWTLKLYTGASGTGTELLNFDFSIIPGPGGTSTKTAIDFTDVSGVLSGILQTRNNSGSGGVGLAEFGFIATPVPAPEPSSVALLGLGMVALATRRRRHRAPRAMA